MRSFKFPDVFTKCIYEYILKHDGELILYKDLMDEYKMCYTTVRKKVNWLIKNQLIVKNKRRFNVIPHF